ncbi:succinate--CoA ligase subunit beta [archaeon]|jgi:succinyl-CoA synthetase beta subunit|nr:succinate--CoA ligase subunit beta [archaeon]
MKLLESQGKEIFKEYGINIPKQFKLDEVDQDVVVKAQVLVGGRGKAGGIKLANKTNVKDVSQQILGMQIKGEEVKQVLIEEKLNIEEEHYLSVTVDRNSKGYICVASAKGGVNIEDVPKEDIVKGKFENIKDKVCAGKQKLFQKLLQIAKEKDAILVEINPLVLSDHKLYAADSKVIIDDNALFRQDFEGEKEGGNYVELDGDVGIIGNGAGLVMGTLDTLAYYGGKPANFLDVGGGSSTEVVEDAIDRVLENKNVKKLLVNIFAGISRCDEVAQAIVNKKIGIPMVVRMVGTNQEKGREILLANGIKAFDSMEECVKEIVK